MDIGVNQKKIINIVKKNIKEIENSGNNVGTSSLTYFAMWGRTPAFEKLKFKLKGVAGTFTDRYFKINSENFDSSLFFLI